MLLSLGALSAGRGSPINQARRVCVSVASDAKLTKKALKSKSLGAAIYWRESHHSGAAVQAQDPLAGQSPLSAKRFRSALPGATTPAPWSFFILGQPFDHHDPPPAQSASAGDHDRRRRRQPQGAAGEQGLSAPAAESSGPLGVQKFGFDFQLHAP